MGYRSLLIGLKRVCNKFQGGDIGLYLKDYFI